MPQSTDNDPFRAVYSVSELSGSLRLLLEDALPDLWVRGEISNFAKPASGHWYFTLKDDRSQLRCVMFRSNNAKIRIKPTDGEEILVHGRVSLYPGRGDLQIICEYLESAGTGALIRAYEELKNRLAAEGLFSADLKQTLPSPPHHIGLITSGSGAALQDVLTTLTRRWPIASVYLWPVAVQGATASSEIVDALKNISGRAPIDLVLLVRGGGSLEDLWPFNEEPVARAIRDCNVPIITGIGHETDFTIADFAADLRAATPTAAAELATPDIQTWINRLENIQTRLHQGMRQHIASVSVELAHRERHLQRLHPATRLRDQQQRLDDFDLRLRRCVRRHLQRHDQRLNTAVQRTMPFHPVQHAKAAREDMNRLLRQLVNNIQMSMRTWSQRLQRDEDLLDSLSPLAVLNRGYALVTNKEGDVVQDVSGLSVGSRLDVRLARGTLEAEVLRLLKENMSMDRKTGSPPD